MTYALIRKDHEQFAPAVRWGQPGIRAMFRILATRIEMHRDGNAWLPLTRPVLDIARHQIEARSDDGRAEAAHDFVEDCVLGLISLWRPHMPEPNSIVPNLAVLLAASKMPAAPLFSGELRIIVGSEGASAQASYLAERIADGLAALHLSVNVTVLPSQQFDGNVGDGSRWKMIWGLPSAVYGD